MFAQNHFIWGSTSNAKAFSVQSGKDLALVVCVPWPFPLGLCMSSFFGYNPCRLLSVRFTALQALTPGPRLFGNWKSAS